MTRSTMRTGRLKAAVAAFAVLVAAAALAVLGTASTTGGRSALDRPTETLSLEQSPLGR